MVDTDANDATTGYGETEAVGEENSGEDEMEDGGHDTHWAAGGISYTLGQSVHNHHVWTQWHGSILRRGIRVMPVEVSRVKSLEW